MREFCSWRGQGARGTESATSALDDFISELKAVLSRDFASGFGSESQ